MTTMARNWRIQPDDAVNSLFVSPSEPMANLHTKSSPSFFSSLLSSVEEIKHDGFYLFFLARIFLCSYLYFILGFSPFGNIAL